MDNRWAAQSAVDVIRWIRSENNEVYISRDCWFQRSKRRAGRTFGFVGERYIHIDNITLETAKMIKNALIAAWGVDTETRLAAAWRSGWFRV